MEEITHRTVAVNGINMHVAEMGEGPVVLFLHGFPEIWYTWRHQIAGLAARGYRAVAPDLRGYGDTDVPDSAVSYTILHLVGDVVALINELGEDKVFVVGHDWGAIVAWYVCLFRPDKVKALVNLSVPYRIWDHDRKPIEYFRAVIGDDFYMCKFQDPKVEAEFASVENSLLLKKFYASPKPRTEEDISYYASKFDKSGFSGALNYYRSLDLSSELLAPWKGAKIQVPVKFVVGDQDLIYKLPGIKDYIHSDDFKKDVPLLEDVVLVEGAHHFIQQDKAAEITEIIYEFIRKF